MPETTTERLKSGWTTVALGDVVDIINEYWDRDATVPERLVAGEHIDEGDLRVRRWAMTDDDLIPPTFNRWFQAGDVLLHSRNIKKVAQPDFGGITGEKLFIIRSKDRSVILQDLVPFLVQSDVFRAYAESRWAGSTNKFLNKKPLEDFEFPLPPIEEQRRMVQLTLAAEAAAESLRSLHAKAETAYLSLLVDTFRFARKPGVAGSIQSDSRGVNWITDRVDSHYELQLGKMSSAKSRTGSNHFRYVKNNNVLWDEFVLEDLPKMHYSPEERKKFALHTGDLLVCEGGEIGRAAVWERANSDIFYQKALHRLRPKEGASTRFMMHYIRACARFGVLERIATGSTILHLPRERLASLLLPFPSHQWQERYAAQADTLVAALRGCRQRLKDLAQFKRVILTELSQ
jgi:type I restriction enzyme S subunit